MAYAPLSGPVDNGKSYNLERVLRSNIMTSDYYGQLCKILDFMELVDEIYNEVDHVEPWMSGNARGPSSAFCLLFRLFTMELDDDSVKHLIHHRDSPYIRALGFLYIRYVRDPKEFSGWFDPFLRDAEKFAPGPSGKEVTMGAFVRDLILDQYYFETIFPRIPEVTRRALAGRIKKMGFPDKAMGCGGTGGSRRAPSENDGGGGRRPPSVKAALAVNLGQRAPHVQAAREQGRGIDPSRRRGGGGSDDVERERDRGSGGGGGGGRDRDHYDRRDRDRDRDYDRRDRDRDHYDRRDRDRDRDYDRRDRDRDHYDRRDRGRSRSRSRDRGGGDRGGGGGGGRYAKHNEERRRQRSRSRDRR